MPKAKRLTKPQWVQTGDQDWHEVSGGQFVTAQGATGRLADMAPYHLLALYIARRPPPGAEGENQHGDY